MQRRASMRCGAVNRLRRAGVEAAACTIRNAGPRSAGSSGVQLEAGEDHAEKHPAAMLAADEVRVLALPADAGRLGERLLHDRRRIDEHLQLGGRFRRR